MTQFTAVCQATDFHKGDRIRASWFQAKPPGSYSLAGMQTKFAATGLSLTGIIRHIRVDHPTDPTMMRVYVDPEGDWKGPLTKVFGCICGRDHVELDPAWIDEVLT